MKNKAFLQMNKEVQAQWVPAKKLQKIDSMSRQSSGLYLLCVG
jgi:hypothetical protein